MKELSLSLMLFLLFVLFCNLIFSVIVDKVFFGYNIKCLNYFRGIIFCFLYDWLVCNVIISLYYVKNDSLKVL